MVKDKEELQAVVDGAVKVAKKALANGDLDATPDSLADPVGRIASVLIGVALESTTLADALKKA